MDLRLGFNVDGVEGVWNFAFGANMNSKSLADFRGVTPRESVAGFVVGWQWSCNILGVWEEEPSYATIEEVGGDNVCVHGVAHLMSVSDFARVSSTERIYTPTYVDFLGYNGRAVRCCAFVTLPGRCQTDNVIPTWRLTVPSLRYMALVYDGAVDSGLDAQYLEFLRSLPNSNNLQPWRNEGGEESYSSRLSGLRDAQGRRFTVHSRNETTNSPEQAGW